MLARHRSTVAPRTQVVSPFTPITQHSSCPHNHWPGRRPATLIAILSFSQPVPVTHQRLAKVSFAEQAVQSCVDGSSMSKFQAPGRLTQQTTSLYVDIIETSNLISNASGFRLRLCRPRAISSTLLSSLRICRRCGDCGAGRAP